MNTQTTLAIKLGSEFVFNGARCAVTHILDLDKVLLTDLLTGETHQANMTELQPVAKTSNNHDLNSIEESTWSSIQERFNVIKPLLDSAGRTREQVAQRAKAFNLHTNTVYRWIKQYEEGGVLTALSKQPRLDKGRARVQSEVEAIIQTAIETEYLTGQRKSAQKVCIEVKRLCLAASLKPPHDNTIRSRIQQLAPQIKTAKRQGKQAADEVYAPINNQFPNANSPLAAVEIDHTKLDIILVDDIHRRPIGRPWITVAIDVFSRMITGFYVSFDPPSALSTGLCLAHGIIAKESWLTKHEVKGTWPCWGLPKKIHLDNAKEFRGKMLQRACQQYGIDIEWRPVARPHFGGHIERAIGTLLTEIHTLSGTTFSNTIERKGYDSEDKAILTLSEFETWLTTFITDVYHQRIHTSLGTSPLTKYKEGILGNHERPGAGLPPKIIDETKLRLDFMPFEERTVQQYGVALDEVHYWHDVLRPWIGATEPSNPKVARKFIFRRDPRDISVIWFFDPELRSYFTIPYRDGSHPVLSIWELREAKRILKAEGKKHIDERMIFSAYERMRTIEQAAAGKTKAARRAQQRRSTNHGTRIQIPIKPLSHDLNMNNPIDELSDDIQPFDDLDDLS
ncbi:transposase [Formosimonas limnophila]|uniref:Transposase n=1 Tax=Formosimonas limnophila TaxID=1384487 RepID=A0A8J3CGV1_9BURK|nr:Mu transposase C-terminal domain-containing protein [Formosimonas limnophila]GHA70417.1 transposase [Formosimonas limnophila]